MKHQKIYFSNTGPGVKFTPVMSAVTISLLLAFQPAVANSYFNPAFLSDGNVSVADLSRFEQGGQLQGSYQVDIYVNQHFVGQKTVRFINTDNNVTNAGGSSGGLTPCINESWLENLGVNTTTLSGLDGNDKTCLNVGKLIPSSSINYNFSAQRLDFSFPQAQMRQSSRDYIPPSEWNEGIPALLMNYDFSGDSGTNGKSAFLSLGSGVNLGAWRLRNNSTWSHNETSKGGSTNSWSNVSTYLERAIIPLKSEFVAGDSNTNNDVFDSIGFRGIRIYSDDAMYPDSEQGFAPTIRGVANTRAKVTVTQNGYTIYQTYVSPGAFAFDDMNPTSSSGDLTVTVQETDGKIHSFIVPYSTVPLLQREGRIKYDLVAGNYRSGSDDQGTPFFTQATLMAGIRNGITLYGGSQLSSNYKAFTAGFGKNMGTFGAVSVDATQARSTLADDSTHQGQSYRFLYAKSLNQMGTTFQLLGYRYSTRGFYSLQDTAYKNIAGYQYGYEDNQYGNQVYTATSYHNLNYARKGSFQINVNQNLNDFGSLYAALSEQSYWNTSDSNKTYQVGYSNSWHNISYNLVWSTTKSVGLSDKDRVVALTVSVPLRELLPSSASNNTTDIARNMYINSNLTRNSNGNNTWQTGVNGTLLRDNNFSYSVAQGHSTNNGNSGNASAQLQGRYGTVNTGYSYTKNDHDYTLQVTGGVIAHQNGVTFSQPLGDTNILVQAPGAKDVSLENQTGVATDFRGYTVIPYANVYRLNRVALDTQTMNFDTDINDNVRNLVPTRGALVRASFNTRIGQRALITLSHNQHPIPFGASVDAPDSNVSSVVADNGQVYLSGLAQTGKLIVKWGNTHDTQCEADYVLSPDSKNVQINTLTIECK